MVKETKEQVDIILNDADFNLVQIGCECGHKFDMPWDAMAFGGLGENSFCGQCGESGKMQVVADPSPNKPNVNKSQ